MGTSRDTAAETVTNVGGLSGANFFTAESSEEADKIMAEAAAVAEKRMSELTPIDYAVISQALFFERNARRREQRAAS